MHECVLCAKSNRIDNRIKGLTCVTSTFPLRDRESSGGRESC